MNIFKIGAPGACLLQRNRRLIATSLTVFLCFLVMSTSALADIINVSVAIGNNGDGSGSVTPGLPPFLIQDAAGPGVCGICAPGIHPVGGTSFLLNLLDTTIGNTYQGHLNFHGPATWEQPAGDPLNPLAVTFPVTFHGLFSSLSGPPTELLGSGTGSIQLGLPVTGDERLYLSSIYTITATSLPEPGTALLLITGVAVLLWPKRREYINHLRG